MASVAHPPGHAYCVPMGNPKTTQGVAPLVQPSTTSVTMKPAAEDLENRRRAWEALSDLYLDTDTSRSRSWRAQTLAASPYSLEELDQILIDEIDPACRTNSLSTAGEWAGFDMEWLENRILQQSGSRRLFR